MLLIWKVISFIIFAKYKLELNGKHQRFRSIFGIINDRTHTRHFVNTHTHVQRNRNKDAREEWASE